MKSGCQSLCCETIWDAIIYIQLRYNSSYKTLKDKTLYIIKNTAHKQKNQRSNYGCSCALCSTIPWIWWGEWRYCITFPASAVYVGRWVVSCTGCLNPMERAPVHWSGDWVGCTGGLDDFQNINCLPLPGIKPQFLSHLAYSLVTIPTMEFEMHLFC
jgi:hypothetical protein